jgi:hypothetical protein
MKEILAHQKFCKKTWPGVTPWKWQQRHLRYLNNLGLDAPSSLVPASAGTHFSMHI